MAKVKTTAAPTNPPISYNGTDLTAPAATSQPIYNPQGTIQSYIGQLQQAQTAANVANETRYSQGLGVLTGAGTQSQGYLQGALTAAQGQGQAALQQIEQQRQTGLGTAAQSAVSRGLTNTTIADSLNAGVNRTANLANIQAQDTNLRNQQGVMQSQAQNTNQSAGSIANFIAARNDQQPDQGMLSQLVQNAASNASGAKRTGTIMGGGSMSGGAYGTDPMANTVGSSTSSPGPTSNPNNYFSMAGSGGALGSAGTISSAIAPSAPSGGTPGGSVSMPGSSGGIQGMVSGPASGQGSISITPSSQMPVMDEAMNSPPPSVGSAPPAAGAAAATPTNGDTPGSSWTPGTIITRNGHQYKIQSDGKTGIFVR